MSDAAMLEMCMEQISTNLEELSFLRDLAGHLQLGAGPRGVEPLCAALLPTLQQAAAADCVAFLRAADVEGERYWITVCESSGDNQEFDVAQTMEALLRAFQGRDSSQGFVFNRNGLNPALEGELDLRIRSCVAVEVSHPETPFGWLLAINKQGNADRNLGDGPTFSEQEFGTHEATLMTSVASLLATHARNTQLFEQKESLFLGVVRGMVSALDARDEYTRGHSERVASTARDVAAHMKLPNDEVDAVYTSGLLHDIGKIGVPDDVLLKPGRLTDEEFAIIKQHPTIGYNILKQIDAMSFVLPGVLHHHESVDGSGYPHGLKGDEIPLMARILAVADSFDAMTSTRSYRPAMPLEKAYGILRENSGVQWDADVIDAFFAMREKMNRHSS